LKMVLGRMVGCTNKATADSNQSLTGQVLSDRKIRWAQGLGI
jgi:hypothetical protein